MLKAIANVFGLFLNVFRSNSEGFHLSSRAEILAWTGWVTVTIPHLLLPTVRGTILVTCPVLDTELKVKKYSCKIPVIPQKYL